MQLKDVIQKTTQFFRDKGFESPRLETELLLAHALNWERIKLYLNYDYPLSEAELSAARELVRRRATGEPVAYILGKKDFYNHSFHVSRAVLIPRPETESIVEAVIAWAKPQMAERQINIIDFGTGSGCIGLSVLAEVPGAKLLAVDVSEDAIAVASKNAEALGAADRVTFLAQPVESIGLEQVTAALGGLADVIVANPPYIAEDDPEIQPSVKAFEPATALFSPENGLSHIAAWAKTGVAFLKPGGWMMFEMGYKQGAEARAIFESVPELESVEIVADLAGHERFIRAKKRQGLV
jgi:release factor glutamine methyltransferase